MLRISNIKTNLQTPMEQLPALVQNLLQTKQAPKTFKLVKKAIDARSKDQVSFIYTIDTEFEDEAQLLASQVYPFIEKIISSEPLKISTLSPKHIRPLIIGSGPAGMFAGLALAEAGLNPIIIERGKAVPQRQKDVKEFWRNCKLNLDSNVQFGEGGAGTFSDGKLMSGIKKDVYTNKVFEELVAAGASEDILYLAKPHLGTDKLALIVQKIRAKIINLGGEYRFDNRLENLLTKDNQLVAAQIRNADGTLYEQPVSHLILAIGHSARDTFEMLYKCQVPLLPKSFSVGARIEHPQGLIDKAIYHHSAGNPLLGAADYKMAVHLPNGRSAYTFCMCPGGEVVAAASEPERVVTNGMSYYSRCQSNANSALLVGVTPEDFGGNHPLQGMYWQQDLEHKAYLAGDKSYQAPAQLVGDLLSKKTSTQLDDVIPSYSCGVVLTNLDMVLPNFITDTLRLAISEMDKKLRGFAHPGSLLTAVETRSSSPIKILRDENFESPLKGLYPCGEGAGYAGGIVSAAVDGLKTALNIIAHFV